MDPEVHEGPSVRRAEDAVLVAHAGYLLTTGVWSLVHRRSFERVTGPKRDFWLVRTVGGLAAVMGLTLGRAAMRRKRPAEAAVLGVGSAVVFTAADLHAARTVSRVYLGDVVLQPVFALAWIRATRR